MANPLPVVWLPQKPGRCGAACAQMILNAKGVIGTAPSDEVTLWNAIKANTGPASGPLPKTTFSLCGTFPSQVIEKCSPVPFCWCTYPDALSATLNQFLAASATSVCKESSEADVTARAVQSVDADLAAAVVVQHGTHWVVVFGYQPSPLPAGQGPTHLYVHDPEFHAASALVDINDWFALYLTDIRCGTFKSHSIAVSGGATAALRTIPQLSAPLPPMLPPIVPADQIAARARADADWLLHAIGWPASLGAAKPGAPLLVRNLNDSLLDYYVVDFRTGGRPTARMLFDARRAGSSYAGIDSPAHHQTYDQLPALVDAADIQLPAPDPGAPAAPISVDPELVWKPCDQSHSPFQPFYVARRGSDVFYVRVDGIVSRELTAHNAGA